MEAVTVCRGTCNRLVVIVSVSKCWHECQSHVHATQTAMTAHPCTSLAYAWWYSPLPCPAVSMHSQYARNRKCHTPSICTLSSRRREGYRPAVEPPLPACTKGKPSVGEIPLMSRSYSRSQVSGSVCMRMHMHTQKARALHMHVFVYLAPVVVAMASVRHQPRVGAR